jgi:phosphotriesterase-related protein
MTVLGPVPVGELGTTLMHEHLFVDARGAVSARTDPEVAALLDRPVATGDLALLREHPYASLDNCLLDNVDIAITELDDFVRSGGRTIVEVTPDGIGRSPEKLRRVAVATGLNVVMGCGLYIERAHPPWAQSASKADIAGRLLQECRAGVDGVRPGIIGEIGVSPEFTAAERRAVRAAASVQAQTGLPLMIHLPGWQRRAHDVLDECEAAGAPAKAVILAHLDPAGADRRYLTTLAERGAHLEFDGLGMGLSFDGEGEMPSDAQTASAVVDLCAAGFSDRILLSHDVFLKVQLRAFGGNGYAHVLRSFLPRLERLGLDAAVGHSFVVDNPRLVFEEATTRD